MTRKANFEIPSPDTWITIPGCWWLCPACQSWKILRYPCVSDRLENGTTKMARHDLITMTTSTSYLSTCRSSNHHQTLSSICLTLTTDLACKSDLGCRGTERRRKKTVERERKDERGWQGERERMRDERGGWEGRWKRSCGRRKESKPLSDIRRLSWPLFCFSDRLGRKQWGEGLSQKVGGLNKEAEDGFACGWKDDQKFFEVWMAGEQLEM